LNREEFEEFVRRNPEEALRLIVKAFKPRELLKIGDRSYVNAFKYPESRFDPKDLLPNGGSLQVLKGDMLQPLRDPSKTFTDQVLIPPSQLVFKLADLTYRKSGLPETAGQIAGGLTNAMTVLQDAVNTLPADGGKVFIKKAEYRIPGILQIKNKSNITFEGDYPILKAAVSDGIALLVGDHLSTSKLGENVLIRGIIFHGGAPDIAKAAGLDISAYDNVIVEKCVFTGCDAGAFRSTVWSEGEYRKKNIVLKDSYFYGNPARHLPPVVLGGIDGGAILNCYFTGASGVSTYIDFSFGEMNNSLIRDFILANNRFIGAYGSSCVIGGFQRVEDVYIVDNVFRDCPKIANAVSPSVAAGVSLLQHRLHIVGNKVINSNQLLAVYRGASISDSIIADNIADTLSGTFMSFRGDRGIIARNWARNVRYIGIVVYGSYNKILDNYLEDCALAGNWVYYFLEAGSLRNDVIGNTARCTGSATTYAFREWDATADYNLFMLNRIEGAFLSPAIYKRGANSKVHRNFGYDTENFKSTGVSVTVGTGGVYGSPVSITSPSGVITYPKVKITWRGTFGTGETVTVKVEAVYSDGTTAYVEKSATAIGSLWLSDDDVLSIITQGKDIVKLNVYAKSSLASTTVTVTVDAYGKA